MARRIGIDHGAAPDRRPAAQDDPVAARCNHRRREPELGVAAGRGDAGEDGARPVVHEQALAVRDRLELVERDVQPEARAQRARRDQDVAAPQLAPLDPRQRQGHPLAGLGPLDRLLVHLDAAHAHLAPGRLHP